MYRLFPDCASARPEAAFIGRRAKMLTLARTMMGDPAARHHRRAHGGPGADNRGRWLPNFCSPEGERVSVSDEQKLRSPMQISQRVYVMGHGHMVFEGTPSDLKANKLIRQEWLEV